MLVTLENVHRDYQQGRVQALRGVSLQVGEGDALAILGSSGSGKSTLLHLMGAMDEPSSGRVIFGEEEPRTARERAWIRARKIGFIFQAFHLVPGLTALENVQVPMFPIVRSSRERRERARALLEAVGLGDRGKHLPRELSGGEQQRVAIARALANRPPLLLADEPTGNLDYKNSMVVMDLLLSLRAEHEMALVVVTHSEAVADRFGRRIETLDGRIVDKEQT